MSYLVQESPLKSMIRKILALSLISATAFAQNRPVAYVDTVAHLDARSPLPNETVYVRGYSAVGDWGAFALPYVYSSTSSNTVDRFTRSPVTGTGRYIYNWDGDPRAFGAIPYSAPYNIMPWGYKTNINAIGTNSFSVWLKVKIPSSITDPIGMFGLSVSTKNTNGVSVYNSASLCLRASSTTFGFLSRSTNGSSSIGAALNDASTLDTTPAALSAYLGTTVDLVFTRAGTNVLVYLNGVNQTALFTNNNPAGWAKSLCIGTPVLASAAIQENLWSWPEPISRFAVWNSALSAGQAADPNGTGSKIIDFTSPVTAVPTEASTGINAALVYAASKGGGIVRLPAGCYRIGAPIRMRPNTFLVGAGSAYYPAPPTFFEGFTPSGTTLAPWFGNEGDVVQTLRSDGGEGYFAPTRAGGGASSYTNATAAVYTLMSKSGVRDLSVYGGLAKHGRAFFADRVGSINYENVGVVLMPGPALYSVQANSLMVSKFSGSYGRGLIIYGAADSVFTDIHWDGPAGPAIWLRGNLNNIDNIVAEFAVNPRASWEFSTTVDSSTDTFTTSSAHRFSTGDLIRFTTDSGTLPSPIRADVDYFVYRVSSTQFWVSYKYCDDISFDGVMDGGGKLDITTAGSGTWYAGPGPAVGMLLMGDNNNVNGLRSQRNYSSALRLENAFENTIGGFRGFLSGYGNSNLTNLAVVSLYNCYSNIFSGSSISDRNIAGYATNGVYFDPTSFGNVFDGVMRFSTLANWNKYIGFGPPTNRWTDTDAEILGATGSKPNFLIPSTAGFTEYADARAIGSSRPMIFDSSNRRLFMPMDNTSANWLYMPGAPWFGPIYWSFLQANGALTAANGGAGATMLSIVGTGFDPLVKLTAFSTTAGLGPNVQVVRNRSGTNGVYIAVQTGDTLGAWRFAGYYTNTVGGIAGGAEINPAVTENWETGKAGTKLEFKVVRNGSTTVATAVAVKSDGRLKYTFQSSAPTVDLEDGDTFYGVNAGTTNLWVRRDAAWVGTLP